MEIIANENTKPLTMLYFFCFGYRLFFHKSYLDGMIEHPVQNMRYSVQSQANGGPQSEPIAQPAEELLISFD